jgi:hypothetical protein
MSFDKVDFTNMGRQRIMFTENKSGENGLIGDARIWKDKGDKIELHFLLGAVDDFFDLDKNKKILQAVNERTVLLDKSAEEIWIMKSLCKREL